MLSQACNSYIPTECSTFRTSKAVQKGVFISPLGFQYFYWAHKEYEITTQCHPKPVVCNPPITPIITIYRLASPWFSLLPPLLRRSGLGRFIHATLPTLFPGFQGPALRRLRPWISMMLYSRLLLLFICMYFLFLRCWLGLRNLPSEKGQVRCPVGDPVRWGHHFPVLPDDSAFAPKIHDSSDRSTNLLSYRYYDIIDRCGRPPDSICTFWHIRLLFRLRPW